MESARQGADVKASFEAGIREYPGMLGRRVGEGPGNEPSSREPVWTGDIANRCARTSRTVLPFCRQRPVRRSSREPSTTSGCRGGSSASGRRERADGVSAGDASMATGLRSRSQVTLRAADCASASLQLVRRQLLRGQLPPGRQDRGPLLVNRRIPQVHRPCPTAV